MRALWLIDGSYLYKAMKEHQRNNPEFANKGIDYTRLKKEIIGAFDVRDMDSYYFNSTPDPATDAQNNYHSWLKSPESSGGPNIRVKLYDLKRKTINCQNCSKQFTLKTQKGVDVGLATFALRLFSKFDAIILSGGDGDYEDAIKYIVEDNDKKFFIAGFEGSISPDLTQYSNDVYYLNRNYPNICDSRDAKPFDTIDSTV